MVMKNIAKLFERFFYKGLDDFLSKDEDVNKNDFDPVVYDEDNLKFYKTVFSSDPVTGNPQSEIAYMLSGADEGFKQFLKEKLFNPVPAGSLAEDSDTAMALVHKNVYTQEQFSEICRDYVTNMMNESKDG